MTNFDLNRVSKSEAAEFMNQFVCDQETLRQIAMADEGWSHMSRVMARIAFFGLQDETFNAERMYIEERKRSMTSIDHGDPTLAELNAKKFILKNVVPEAADLSGALKYFSNPDGTNVQM